MHKIFAVSLQASCLVLLAAFAAFSQDNSSSSSNKWTPQFSPEQQKPTLLEGTFKPYTAYDRIKVTATLIANPNRLNNVSIGYAIPLVEFGVDDSEAASILHAIEKGTAVVAVKHQGKYDVLPDQHIAGSCNAADQVSCYSKMVEMYKVQLRSNLDNKEKDIAIITTQSGSAKFGPANPVINWDTSR